MSSARTRHGLAIVGSALLVVLPLLVRTVLPSSWELIAHVSTKMLMNVAFGLCLWLMLQAGMLSLGQGAFITISAYTTAVLTAKYHLVGSVWGSYLIGAAVVALFALGLGLITVHLRRIFFLLVTWSFGEMISPVLTSFETPFGAAAGIVDIPAPSGFTLFHDMFTGYYYLALAFAGVVFVVVSRIAGSRLGLAHRSIGQNDTLSTFCGLHVRAYKIRLFVIASVLTAVGGGIMASYLTALSPDTFSFFTSLDIVMFVLIGGPATLAGPIVGAVVLTGANELLFGVGYYKMIFYGLVITLVIRMLPGGLVSLPTMLSARAERLRTRKEGRRVTPGTVA